MNNNKNIKGFTTPELLISILLISAIILIILNITTDFTRVVRENTFNNETRTATMNLLTSIDSDVNTRTGKLIVTSDKADSFEIIIANEESTNILIRYYADGKDTYRFNTYTGETQKYAGLTKLELTRVDEVLVKERGPINDKVYLNSVGPSGDLWELFIHSSAKIGNRRSTQTFRKMIYID